MSTYFREVSRSPRNSKCNYYLKEREAEDMPPDKKMKITTKIDIEKILNTPPRQQKKTQLNQPETLELQQQHKHQQQQQQQQQQQPLEPLEPQQQGAVGTGGIQIIQQIIGPDGQLQKNPIQLTPQQLQVIRLQISGETQEPVILQTALTQPVKQSTLQAVPQPVKPPNLQEVPMPRKQSTKLAQKQSTPKTKSDLQQQNKSDIAEKIFQCKYCSTKCKRRKELDFHVNRYHQVDSVQENIDSMKTEGVGGLYVCQYCEGTFKYIWNLNIHVKKYHQVNADNTMSPGDNIHYIEITEGGDDVFACQYCERRSKHESSIKSHIRRFHPGKMTEEDDSPNHCDICGKEFSNYRYVRNHKSRMHNTKRYTCNVCDNFFTTKNMVLKHLKDFHPGFESRDDVWSVENIQSEPEPFKKEHKCQVCSRRFSRKENVRRHMEKEHPEVEVANSLTVRKKNKSVPVLRCWLEDCNSNFSSLPKLRQHLTKAEEDGGHSWIIEEEKKVFDNFEEFTVWKEDVEEAESVRYIKFNQSYYKEMDGSWKRTFYCSRSGRFNTRKYIKKKTKDTSSVFSHQPEAEKIPKRDKIRGTCKIGYICPSAMEVYCNSLGTVTCTYFKTHGHDITDNIMHIPMHRRDRQFIIEKVAEGLEYKKILEEIHKKGGRSAFIILKDIKNCIMSLENPESRILGIENEANYISSIQAIGKEEMFEHERLPLYTYEMDEPESFISMEDDKYQVLSEISRIENSVDSMKAVTHQIKIIDNSVQIIQVNEIA